LRETQFRGFLTTLDEIYRENGSMNDEESEISLIHDPIMDIKYSSDKK
jgi:hypothetical protein